MKSRRPVSGGLLRLCAAAVLLSVACRRPPVAGGRDADALIAVDRAARSLRLPATVHAKAFEKNHYHLIVWQAGGAGHGALFRTPVSDRAVLAALMSLGGHPGDNLLQETWTRRRDPTHPAPALRAEGDPVEISVTWKGLREPRRVVDLFEGATAADFDFRFAGNGRWIAVFRSGCVTCLYSCPGAKVANRAYPVRDYVARADRFRLRAGLLPPDGTPVTIALKLKPRTGPTARPPGGLP